MAKQDKMFDFSGYRFARLVVASVAHLALCIRTSHPQVRIGGDSQELFRRSVRELNDFLGGDEKEAPAASEDDV